MDKLLQKMHVYKGGFPGEKVLTSLNQRRHDHGTLWLSFLTYFIFMKLRVTYLYSSAIISYFIT